MSGYHVQTPYKGFFLIVSCYVGLCLLEACSFLTGNGGEADKGERGGGGKLGAEGGETVIGMYYIRG